jgi:hypothetical protein
MPNLRQIAVWEKGAEILTNETSGDPVRFCQYYDEAGNRVHRDAVAVCHIKAALSLNVL